MKHHATDQNTCLAESISLSSRTDLFEILDNQRICELSALNTADSQKKSGFPDAAAVLRSTGVSSRRILQTGIQPLDLAAALENTLDSQNLGRFTDFHAVLLCHSHTDPAAVLHLANSLKHRTTHHCQLPEIHTFNAGCTGFLQQLQQARQLLQHSAADGRILLLNIETPESWHCAADRAFCGIVGASATATIIKKQGGRPITWLQTSHTQVPHSHHLQPGPLFHTEFTRTISFRGQTQHRCIMRMHGEAVFVHGIELMLQAVRLAHQHNTANTPVTLIPHQPSGKLLRAFTAALHAELPHISVLSNLQHSGNTISATIPELLASHPTLHQPNPHPLILAASGICMPQMHSHMSFGSAYLA